MSTRSVLTSKWSGLNPRLLATLYPVGPDGKKTDGPMVVAPPSDASLELSANWQSPFEQSGAETRAPAITALLQSGAVGPLAQVLGQGSGDGVLSRLAQSVSEFSQSAQGRSGMTKLNSTQVFTGAAPIKITLTLQFRAFDDPDAEVIEPVDQLAKWCLARQLAPNGALVSLVQGLRDGQGVIKSLLPSEAPQMLGLTIDGMTFAPLVLEGLSRSLTGPKSSKGQALNMAVQLSLSSLTALDSGDMARARLGLAANMFGN